MRTFEVITQGACHYTSLYWTLLDSSAVRRRLSSLCLASVLLSPEAKCVCELRSVPRYMTLSFVTKVTLWCLISFEDVFLSSMLNGWKCRSAQLTLIQQSVCESSGWDSLKIFAVCHCILPSVSQVWRFVSSFQPLNNVSRPPSQCEKHNVSAARPWWRVWPKPPPSLPALPQRPELTELTEQPQK